MKTGPVKTICGPPLPSAGIVPGLMKVGCGGGPAVVGGASFKLVNGVSPKLCTGAGDLISGFGVNGGGPAKPAENLVWSKGHLPAPFVGACKSA